MIDLGKVKGEDGVVETVHNGLLGTVVLAGKTCLQWGYFTVDQGNTWRRVNINRPYKDNNYNIQVSCYYRDGYNDVYVGKVDNSGFSVAMVGDLEGTQQHDIYWFCIGEVE